MSNPDDSNNFSGGPTKVNPMILAELQTKISDLAANITNEWPQLPTCLRDIQNLINSDPECLTVLTPEDVGLTVRGLMKYKTIAIIPEKPKKEPKEPKVKGEKAPRTIKGVKVGDLEI